MLYLNDREIKFGKYPNLESYLSISDLDIKEFNYIKFVFESNEDLINLAILQEYINDMGAKTCLYITYMPYSRMDRKNDVYSFSLKAICHLINSMGFGKVIVREPHSAATGDYLANFSQDNWIENCFEKICKFSHTASLFYPDFGALARYDLQKVGLPVAYGKKTRDFTTGEIRKYEISGFLQGNVLIVDDICSKGGTFINASKEIRSKFPNVGAINLLVSYCEDNVFNGELFDYIDRIYTSPERELKNHPRIIKVREGE